VKRNEPLKLIPLDELDKVVSALARVPKSAISNPKREIVTAPKETIERAKAKTKTR
jgi:hypothetical protein